MFSVGTSKHFLKYPNDFILYGLNNLKLYINTEVAVWFDLST